jgi:LmbE family N-acetylglucosaminyl deacetylase
VGVNDLQSHGAITRDLPVPSVALAVGAHPDDVEFGCGGTLAKWAAAGCRIHHLVLTDGSKGTWNPSQDAALLVAARQEEQRRAADVLAGVAGHAGKCGEERRDGVTFLGLTDGELRNGVREQFEVCRVIRTVRPDVILGHDPWRRYRLHPDQRNAGFLLTDAMVAARDPLFFADQGLEPHRPSALLLWEADEPNHVEHVKGFESTKVEALLAHQSQHESTMGIVGDLDDAGASGGAGSGEVAAEIEAFRAEVLAQLASHGSLLGLDAGECFRLLEEL